MSTKLNRSCSKACPFRVRQLLPLFQFEDQNEDPLPRRVREQDGVLIYLRELLEAGAITRDAALAIDTAARDEMAGAIRFALDSPYPEPEEALEDVYA